MHTVAHHLQVHAHNNNGPERDFFARSAYNRYYYGCYLLLRSTFAEMNPDWEETPHKSYPDLLNGSITRALKHAKGRAHKAKDVELVAMIDGALRAIPQLRAIIEEANATRIVADYYPRVSVDFDSAARFSLNGVDVSKAHEWQSKVQTLTGSLITAWRQINA